MLIVVIFFFQAEDGIRDVERSRGLGDVYKRQDYRGIFLRDGHPRLDGFADRDSVNDCGADPLALPRLIRNEVQPP